MKKSNWFWLSALLVILLGSGLAWALWSPAPDEPGLEDEVDSVEIGRRPKKKPSAKSAKKGRKAVPRANRPKRARPQRAEAAASGAVDAAADVGDEEKLLPQQKKVLVSLQGALDDNDLKAVRQAIARFNEEGMRTENGEVPAVLRAKAVEALGWFGKDAAIDLISYLGDPNADIAQDAISQFELALEDGDMSDRDRSEIVKAAMRAITDQDVVDSLLFQLNNMRPSVKAETITGILTTGTQPAVEKMTEQLETYTDEGVKDVKGVEKWAKDNPDEPDAEETYGGSKESEATTGKSDPQQTTDKGGTNL